MNVLPTEIDKIVLRISHRRTTTCEDLLPRVQVLNVDFFLKKAR